MFQFLIGTVKTSKILSYPSLYFSVSIPNSYCKNEIWNARKRGIGKFQFLIGTVKTRKKKLPYTLEGRVSIPHRYCKKLGNKLKLFIMSQVSIPHRYCKNSYAVMVSSSSKIGFNSS